MVGPKTKATIRVEGISSPKWYIQYRAQGFDLRGVLAYDLIVEINCAFRLNRHYHCIFQFLRRREISAFQA